MDTQLFIPDRLEAESARAFLSSLLPTFSKLCGKLKRKDSSKRK